MCTDQEGRMLNGQGDGEDASIGSHSKNTCVRQICILLAGQLLSPLLGRIEPPPKQVWSQLAGVAWLKTYFVPNS